MFEAFYSSYWQHPLLLWLAPAVFLIRFPRPVEEGRRGFFSRFVVAFALLTLVDPLMTGPVADSGLLSDAQNQRISIFFVILGDLRFFALFELFSSEESSRMKSWIRAILWSLVVPLLQFALLRLFPGFFSEARYTFLAYELLFLLLALVFRGAILPRKNLSPETRTWLKRSLLYAATYYALWALADVLILAGWDAGYGLRILPNLLYYSFFLPFAYWLAPVSLRARPEVAR